MTPDAVQARIKAAYPDCDVAVIDTNGNEDHFDVRLATAMLKNLSRVQQHQAIMGLFQAELKTGEVHALQIKIVTK
jgi:stress-induced morphogen